MAKIVRIIFFDGMIHRLDISFHPNTVILFLIIAQYNNFLGEETGFVPWIESDGYLAFSPRFDRTLGYHLAYAAASAVNVVDRDRRFPFILKNKCVRHLTIFFLYGAEIVHALLELNGFSNSLRLQIASYTNKQYDEISFHLLF